MPGLATKLIRHPREIQILILQQLLGVGSFLVLIQNERLAIVTLELSSANPQVLFKVSTAGKRAPSFRVNQHLLRKHKNSWKI